MKNKRIVIVGSGIAGMSAAIRLSVMGHHVHVFEARAPKEEYLVGLDEDLVKNAAKDLVVGSMTSAKINGNWE